MKILVIEDDPALQQTLQDILELNGHIVWAAGDGEEGLRLAKQGPDFVFCDIGLPGMNGFAVLAAFQTLAHARKVPFVFLTARTDRTDQRRGMVLGADDYVTKPFSEREILDAITACAQRLRPLRERIEQLVAERRCEADAEWSHELMTPMTGVLGGLELIEFEADRIGPEELKGLLRLIREGAERQLKLSRKLVRYFELLRLRERPGSEPKSPANTEVAVAAAVARVAAAAKRQADVRVSCEPAWVALTADWLTDAVAELVDNACRFSRPGQQVIVTGRREGCVYRVVVNDEGLGMTTAQRQNVGAFVQFDRQRREQQGLGLGLALARSTAELVGGRLELTEGSGGQGVAAGLELPLTTAPEASK